MNQHLEGHANPGSDAASIRRRRGFGLLLLSVLLTATGMHLARLALANSTPLTVTLIQGATTFAAFFLLGWCWRQAGWTAAQLDTVRPAALTAVFRANLRIFLPAPLLLALNGWLVNTSMSRYGVETTAFLANLTFVFLVLGGWLSGERTRLREVLAISLMLGGAFLFSYRGGGTAWGAIGLMSGAGAIMAGKQLLVKHVSAAAPLPVVMCAVMGLSLPWTITLLAATGQGQWPSLRTLGFAVSAALLVSVAGMSLMYRAYHLVGVARGAPFNTLRPLFVLLIGLAFGHGVPPPLQAAGGLLILVGSLGLALGGQRHAARTPASLGMAKPGAASESRTGA